MMVHTSDGVLLIQIHEPGTAGADGVLWPAGRRLVPEPVREVAGLIVGVALLEYVNDLHEATPVAGAQPATPRK